MDKPVNIQNLAEEHALELYQSQEIRQSYLKERNQFFLKAFGVTMGAGGIFLLSYKFAIFVDTSTRLFTIGASIFFPLIGLLAFIIYQSQTIYKKRQKFIKNFKTEVVKKIVRNLYPQLSYHTSGHLDLHKLIKTNRYSGTYTLKSWNNQDCIQGNYPNLEFNLLESTVHGISHYDDNDIYKKIFEGLIIHIHTNQTKSQLDKVMGTTAVKKKMNLLQKFWGSYPQITNFHDGDVIIDIVLLKRHFLEPPKAQLNLYEPIYINQLIQEISLLIELVKEIQAQLKTV